MPRRREGNRQTDKRGLLVMIYRMMVMILMMAWKLTKSSTLVKTRLKEMQSVLNT